MIGRRSRSAVARSPADRSPARICSFPIHAHPTMPSTDSSPSVRGLHHVTAIAGDPQENVDFYTGVLGMRLVKQSVNQDSPDTYDFG